MNIIHTKTELGSLIISCPEKLDAVVKGAPKFPPTLCSKWRIACQANRAKRLPFIYELNIIHLCPSTHAFTPCQVSGSGLHTLATVAGNPTPTTYTIANWHMQSFQSCQNDQLCQMLQTLMLFAIDSISPGQTICRLSIAWF